MLHKFKKKKELIDKEKTQVHTQTGLKARSSCPGRKSPTGSWKTETRNARAKQRTEQGPVMLLSRVREPRMSGATVGVGGWARRRWKTRGKDGAPVW